MTPRKALLSREVRENFGAAVLFGVAVLALAGQLGQWAAEPAGWGCGSGDSHAAQGEALIHGLPDGQVAQSMPGASVPNALLCGHAGFAVQVAARGLGLLAAATLVFVLGCLLHSPLCGGLVALGFALSPAPPLYWDRWLYTLHVLLVAGALAWRAQAPSFGRSLILGLAIGMSLFVLSPLFLLPLVLLFEVWRQKGGGRPAQGLAVCLAPLLFLLPWALMNHRLGHGWVFLEAGRARANIITGALGFVSTGQTVWNVLLPGRGGGDGALGWAVSEVLSRPGEYLPACARRLALALSYHPILWAGGLAALCLGWRRDGLRQLGWLALYFLGIHCLMPVEERYFEPLVPVLMTMSAWAVLSRLPAAAPAGGQRAAAAALAGVGALLLAVQVYAQGLVLAYPARAAGPDAFGRELARRPGEAWLWYEHGRRRLGRGEGGGAAEDLGRALALSPRWAEPRLPYLWARMLGRGPGTEFWARLAPETGDPLAAVQGYAVRVLHGLDNGRVPAAREARELMRDRIAGLAAFTREADRARLERLRADWARFESERLEEAAVLWPEARRAELLKRARPLLAEPPLAPARRAGLWLGEAQRSARAGLREGALVSLEAARRLGLAPAQRLTCARLLLSLGEYARAAQVLSRSGPPAPAELDLLMEAARAARAQGQAVLAEQILDLCDRGAVSVPRALAAAGLYRDWGRPADGVALLRRALAGHPRDARLLLELGAAEARTGQRAQAREALAALERLDLDGSQACRAARLAVDLRAAAAGMLGRAMKKGRCDAGLLLDAAAAARDAGRRAEGLEALRLTAGIALTPEQILSAARLHVELGGPARAGRVESDAEERWRAAIAHQRLGEYPQALTLLDRLVREQPGGARWLGDRGVLHLLMGKREAGVRDLQKAIALDPGFLSPYLSLGGLYESEGRRQDARRLYEAALARTVPAGAPADRGLQERIRSERRRLLAEPQR